MGDYPWQGETAKYAVSEIDEIKRRMYQAESDNTTLRQQLEQAEARCAELESALETTVDLLRAWKQWLLRKQAEAIESAKSKIDANAFDRVSALKILKASADQLRQQADELEKETGQ